MPKASISEITTAITIRMTGSRFTELLLQNEPIQERKVMGEQSESPENQQSPKSNQQASAGHLHGVHVAAKSRIELQETTNPERRQQKRYRKPKGINSQQPDSLADRVLRSCKVKDR